MKIDSLKKDSSISSILNRISKLESQIYPVGSVYISLVNTNPSILFGGTWEQLKDRFLLGVGDTYTQGQTGGTETHSHHYKVASIISKMVAADARAVEYSTDTIKGRTLVQSNKDYNTNSQLGSGGAWNYADANYYVSEGKTQTISNMPPYLTVYMWKRVS